MKRALVVIVIVLASACGSSASAPRGRTDVVTAEWSSGDDVPLTTTAPR
jgi:hypothetical protein